MKFSLTVVIPAYNEMTNFQAGKLDQIDRYLQEKKLGWEVLVIDDGSSDGSNHKIKAWLQDKPRWRFIQNQHQVKSNAIKTGVDQASCAHILFTDFDQATPIQEAEKLLPFVKRGYPIVIGSREVQGATRQKEPFYRHLMGKVFNFVVQTIVLSGIHDTQCGFKIFETDTARELFNSLKIYQNKPEKYAFTGAFDVELLFIARKRNIKIAEVPIHWQHAPTSRVNPLRDSIRMFYDVLKIRLYD